MKKINAIIVEDTAANREALKLLLEQKCPQVQLLGEAGTLDEAYRLIKELQPDLVFLDIQMKEGTSFDLLETLYREQAINFEIIFVTAHGKFEYATRAIEYSALDFLTKPIDSAKLRAAIQKAEKKLDDQNQQKQVSLLLELLNQPASKSSKIAFHSVKGILELVEIEHITWLEADGKVTKVHLDKNRNFTALRNLGHYSRMLMAEPQIFPISNKALVNLDHVKKYNHRELTLTLNDGTAIFASRRGGQDLKHFLTENREYRGLQGSGLKNLLGRFLSE